MVELGLLQINSVFTMDLAEHVNAHLWPTDSEANQNHIKDYSIYYIEDSGHFPMLEQTEQFNTTLMKAVKSVK